MSTASICTLATKECAAELALFLRCIRRHHPTVPIHVRTDLTTKRNTEDLMLYLTTGKYRVAADNIHFTSGLEAFGDINRKKMEKTPGKLFRTLHEDFMLEKATVLEEALSVHKSALFLDCDIAFLQPLSEIKENEENASSSKWVTLSPHSIQAEDEALFGKFNGGWLATNDSDLPRRWREYTKSSRYYDQAALERFQEENDVKIDFAPIQSNFGYWRLFQVKHPSEIIEKFKVVKDPKGQGRKLIHYDGKPLQSIHSHLLMPHLCGMQAECFNVIMEKLFGFAGTNYSYMLDAMKNPFSFDLV